MRTGRVAGTKGIHVNKKDTNIKVSNTDCGVENAEIDAFAADFDLTNVDIEAPADGNAVSGGIYENPLSDSGFKKLLASTNSLTNFLNGVMRLDKERENLEKIIAEKDALIAALKAENAHLKAGK